MKSAKIFAVVLLFISFTLTNCSPDRDYLFSTNEIITRGNWGVDFFASPDKTVEYGNYVFQFSGTGTLQGSDGTNTIQGTWNVIQDVDRTDVLNITIKEQNSIPEINNAWSVKAKSAEALNMLAKGNGLEFRIRKI